ncbi:MAG: GDSL-type esterase/lipase family protein [Faecalibacterium sp.]|nr:GDSL-type esterase/lipase family protein [Faecalibacterium sp.]MDY4157844.1 SGNH/GDSL hydrolase family protein [Faecalibacterium sp.]
MRNTRPEKQSLTPMQKQAVLVCSVCALAAILTIAITMTLLKRGKTPSAPVEQPSSEMLVPGEEDISDHYQINETSSALLPEAADAGEDYQKETLFIGDSNTVRLYANGLISLQQFCAKEGIGTHAALTEGIVTFKKDNNSYTIAQAVAKMKPRRVVIMLGTNDSGMAVEEFINNYTALVQAIQESYPYTDIIVNTVPPVPANHANYPNMDQTKIDDFNMALLSMCEQMGLKFLNSAEALKDANGYGREDYYQTGDIHLKPVGLKAMLSYLRTHAYQTDDRRPDTANIPTRAEYIPNPSSAVTAPSSSEAAGSSEGQGVLYQAAYRVDKNGGGTLSSGSDSGKTSLSYEVTSAAQSISVTAVPQDGYVFVKWSDGVTQKTRTDTNFKQNVDVTAMFAQASISISSTGKAVLGDYYTFTAKLGGKHLTADSIRWYANGVEVPQAAGKTTVKVEIDPSMLNATFKVYAVASYNGCTVTSNVLNVTVSGVSAGSASSSGSTSSSSSGSTSSSSSSSAASSGASSGSTSASDSTSHGTSSSESTAPSASTSSSNGESSSSHSTGSNVSSSESNSSSHSSSATESSSHTGSSSATESGSHTEPSEANASKETTNEQAAPTDSAS